MSSGFQWCLDVSGYLQNHLKVCLEVFCVQRCMAQELTNVLTQRCLKVSRGVQRCCFQTSIVNASALTMRQSINA